MFFTSARFPRRKPLITKSSGIASSAASTAASRSIFSSWFCRIAATSQAYSESGLQASIIRRFFP